jgi:hypothetical protein
MAMIRVRPVATRASLMATSTASLPELTKHTWVSSRGSMAPSAATNRSRTGLPKD